LPRIDQHLLDSVVYLYPSEESAETGTKIGGSGFLIGIWSGQEKVQHLYVVTNRHVVDGGFSVVRITGNNDETVIRTVPEDEQSGWKFPHDPDDLAVWYLGGQPIAGEQKFSFVPFGALVSQADRGSYCVGDECFMLGRFIRHDGKQRNLPTARFGNISMLPEEQILNSSGQLVDAFLVETRSQAGYSGSPVFVYHEGVTAYMPVREASAHKRSVSKIKLDTHESMIFMLLGIDCAHLPNAAIVTQVNENGGLTQRPHPDVPDARVELGSGMLAVVPAWKLADLLNRDDVRPAT